MGDQIATPQLTLQCTKCFSSLLFFSASTFSSQITVRTITMAETDEYRLPSSGAQVDDERDVEESKRAKLLVLIGSGILQLPIWGTSIQVMHVSA